MSIANLMFKENDIGMKLLEKDFEDIYKEIDLDEDTKCGWGNCRDNSLIKRLASKKVYVFIHGMVGCFIVSTFAYFNATITTLEKRYKIPSQNVGTITIGYDLVAFISAPLLSHYLSKSHKPRWIAFTALYLGIYCFLIGFLHFMYGPGEDALSFTTEYSQSINSTLGNKTDSQNRVLCHLNDDVIDECENEVSSWIPQVYLFFTQCFSGIFGPLYDSLGTVYMDDNIQKSKIPIAISFSYFIRMLGPAFGYTVASYSLAYYIAPDLTPTINSNDSRWLGAWWLGWIILGILLSIMAIFMSCFPKHLPRATVRRMISLKKEELKALNQTSDNLENKNIKKTKGLIKTFKRVLTNKTLMFNNVASIFYFFSALPYWMFAPKYIETQYRISASQSSLLTGTVVLVFTALGIMVSGLVISKLKPKARTLAGWNVFVGFATAVLMIGYTQLGCDENDNLIKIISNLNENLNGSCSSNCHCDFVKYSPVCGEDGNTYISPCHAGCTEQIKYENGTKLYENCLCIEKNVTSFQNEEYIYGSAKPGTCPVNCYNALVLFVIALCIDKFIGSSGRASNFLISVRCVKEEDKSVSVGIGMTILALFAFVPSPIIFGWIFDQACIVWGKTCTGTGNCWLYDGESMRFYLNVTAAVSVLIGTLCDCFVWYFVKDLQVFDESAKNKIKISNSKVDNEYDNDKDTNDKENKCQQI